MVRVLLFFILVGVFAIGAAWLADRPGLIVLNWLGYRIEISLLAATVILVAIIFAVSFVWSLVRGLVSAPTALGGFFRHRREERGHEALTRGMIAIGTGNVREASKQSAVATRVLNKDPLALLLRAQTAQLKGDREGAKRAFKAMLKSSATESLGLRGLFVEAQRQDDAASALVLAERALKTNRATDWAATALFEMQCAAHKWEMALETLAENVRQGVVEKKQANRWRAVLLTARADELETSDKDRALELAEEAHGLAPDLVPAAVLAGSLVAEAGNIRRANRILEKIWKASPHPDIAEAYGNLRAGDSVRDRLKRVKTLAQKNADHPESAIAVAGAAIDALDWKTARSALEPLLSDKPSQRVCTLMAEVDQGEHGDRGRAREWLARAMRAPRDPVWTADGLIAEEWAPVSPVSGRLDAYEWRVPVERLGVAEGLEDEDFEPIPDIELEAELDDAVDVSPEDVADAVETVLEDEPAAEDADNKKPRVRKAKSADRKVDEKVVIAPDDPGADGADLADEDVILRR